MSSNLPTPRLTDTQLDAALASHEDTILPSSGFADAVMASVNAQAAGPAPIPFPWKHAVPGFVAIVGAIALVVTACVAWLRYPAAVQATPLHLSLEPLLRTAAGADAAWILLSLAIPAFCLLLMRRLFFAR